MSTRMIQTVLFVLGAAVIGILLYWQVEAIHRGGLVMILIVMCSIFALSIALERLYYFFRLGSGRDQFFEGLREALHKHKWSEAQELCKQTPGPLARVADAGIGAHEAPADEIAQIMQEVAQDEEPLVEQHVRWLATIAQVATLLGLLGTVIGMVEAFQVIQSKATSVNPVSPGDLAGGIWQALTTTVAGLEVAIPTILAYNYFNGRIAEVQFHMEKLTRLVAGWRRKN